MFSSRLRQAAGRNRLAVALDRRRASGPSDYRSHALQSHSRRPRHIRAGCSRRWRRTGRFATSPNPSGCSPQGKPSPMTSHGAVCPVPANRIVLTASTSEAYSLLFKLLCDPGDAVLAPRPSYPLVEHLTDLDGVALEHYRLEFHGRWELDLQDLREKAGSGRMRAIIMISPNNPTGSVVTDAELDAMAALAREHDLALISDEVFADYPISGTQPASALRQQTALTFALGGLSKSVGLPQVKLGWIAVGGPAPLVADALERLETICDAYLSVSTPVQVAAPDLLTAGAAVRTQIQARVRENYAQLTALASAQSCVRRAAGRSRMVRRRAGAGGRVRGHDRARPARTTRACSCIPATSSISSARRFSSSVCFPSPSVFASCGAGALRPDRRAPMIPRSRRAGISVPLFSLRSTRSWGIGEIGDIPAIAEWLRAGESVGAADPAAERAGAVGVVAVLGAQRDGDRSAVHQHLDDGRRGGVRARMASRDRARSSDAEGRLQSRARA